MTPADRPTPVTLQQRALLVVLPTVPAGVALAQSGRSMIRDGEHLARALRHAMPLAPALQKGLPSGLAFWLLGVEGALSWAVPMFVAARQLCGSVFRIAVQAPRSTILRITARPEHATT